MILEVAGASLAAELAPVERRGTYLALFGCFFGASYGISPIAAGLLLDAELPEIIWIVQLVASTLALVSLFILAALKKSSQLSARSGERRSTTQVKAYRMSPTALRSHLGEHGGLYSTWAREAES